MGRGVQESRSYTAQTVGRGWAESATSGKMGGTRELEHSGQRLYGGVERGAGAGSGNRRDSKAR